MPFHAIYKSRLMAVKPIRGARFRLSSFRLLGKPEVIVEIPMDSGVLQAPAGLSQCHLGIHRRHTQGPERRPTQGWYEIQDSHLLVESDKPQCLISCPDADGDLLDYALDIFESGVAEQRLQFLWQ